MEEINYEKIGFKSGIEIHQQLDTHKLFCNCPSLLRSDNPEYEITRKLHAIAGETGEIDKAVEYEAQKNKEFIYQAYDTTCLVELDEEPPHLINEEALKIALQISVLLNCEILNSSQIMRKTVIDGSNTGGFQRTVLIAQNGFVETPQGKVRIESVVLEEDAARIIKREKNKVIYRLDRLGIPLIEIATAPDIKNAEHVKQTALKLGEILRSCKVKRGIGTIRQDVNISIQGHPRVEIKGFQDLKIFEKTVDNEIKRQIKNIQAKKTQSEVRNANADATTSFLRPMPGKARMYPETDLPLLKISKQLLDEARKNLPKLKSEINTELEKQGLNKEMITLLFNYNALEDYKELYQINKNPNLIAKMLVLWPKEIASKQKTDFEKIRKKLTLDILEHILNELKKGKIQENHIKDIMIDIVEGKNLEDAIKIEQADESEIEQEIVKIIKQKPGLTINGYMGLIMQRFKGKISGKQIIEILKKHIK